MTHNTRSARDTLLTPHQSSGPRVFMRLLLLILAWGLVVLVFFWLAGDRGGALAKVVYTIHNPCPTCDLPMHGSSSKSFF